MPPVRVSRSPAARPPARRTRLAASGAPRWAAELGVCTPRRDVVPQCGRYLVMLLPGLIAAAAAAAIIKSGVNWSDARLMGRRAGGGGIALGRSTRSVPVYHPFPQVGGGRVWNDEPLVVFPPVIWLLVEPTDDRSAGVRMRTALGTRQLYLYGYTVVWALEKTKLFPVHMLVNTNTVVV